MLKYLALNPWVHAPSISPFTFWFHCLTTVACRHATSTFWNSPGASLTGLLYLDVCVVVRGREGVSRPSLSQPDRTAGVSGDDDDDASVSDDGGGGQVVHPLSFSQPVQPHDMLLGSQFNPTPGTSQVRVTRLSISIFPHKTFVRR